MSLNLIESKYFSQSNLKLYRKFGIIATSCFSTLDVGYSLCALDVRIDIANITINTIFFIALIIKLIHIVIF